MSNTKVSNQKLMSFIRAKVEEKKEFLKYNFVEDSNTYTLKFMIYLLTEEIEIIIKNIDGRSGMGKLIEFDKKLEKRNNIINYLIREKMIFSKFITKVMEIFQSGQSTNIEIDRKIRKMKPFPGKQEILDDLSTMKNDYAQLENFKAFIKEYFTDTDYQNFLLSQPTLKNPMESENFEYIKGLQTSFDKLNRYDTIQKDYDLMVKESDARGAQYIELMERYEDLVDDFVLYTQKNTVSKDFQGKGDGDSKAEVESIIREKHRPDRPLHEQAPVQTESKSAFKGLPDQNLSRNSLKSSQRSGKQSQPLTKSQHKEEYVSHEELQAELRELQKKLDTIPQVPANTNLGPSR